MCAGLCFNLFLVWLNFMAGSLGVAWPRIWPAVVQLMLGLRLCLGRRRKQNGLFPALQAMHSLQTRPDAGTAAVSKTSEQGTFLLWLVGGGTWRDRVAGEGLVRRSVQRQQMG